MSLDIDANFVIEVLTDTAKSIELPVNATTIEITGQPVPGPAGASGNLPTDTFIASLVPGVTTLTGAAIADKIQGVSLSELRPWFAAVADRQNNTAVVSILGASITEGAYVSSFSRTIGQTLASLLRANIPTPGITGGGRGFIGIPSRALVTQAQYTANAFWPLVFTGGLFDPTDPAAAAHDLGAKHVYWTTNAAGNKFVDTLVRPVTSFDIHHIKSTTGGAACGYYKIDGGTAVSFSTIGASDYVNEVLHIASPATSTIEVGWNATGLLSVHGITEYDGDESGGIQVHNLGHAGMTLARWQTGYATAGGWLSAVAALNSDVIIMPDLGVNDLFQGMLPADVKTAFLSFIAVLRGGGITCPIILLSYVDPSGASPLPTGTTWAQYQQVWKEIADADPTILLADIAPRLPSTVGTDVYGLYSTTDHLHARPGGNLDQWIADYFASILVPR